MRRSFRTIAVFFVASGSLWPQAPAVTRLELRKPVVRESGPVRSDTFTVEAGAGQFVQLILKKEGVDVTVTVSAPDGKEVLSVNGPNLTWGPEPISWSASVSGVYQIVVAKSIRSAETGQYEIEWRELRRPTDRDFRQIDAERLLAKAVEADWPGPKNSYPEALGAYENAAALWRALEVPIEESLCLNRIGFYAILKENQKALAFYNKELSIERKAGYRYGEANTLRNIAHMYSTLGEKQKALEYFNQALTICRMVGDRSDEARASSKSATCRPLLMTSRRRWNTSTRR
jgi:hypothetical protein